MARQERPVDPAAGPLQAFAHGLRKMRTEAGNPTYRVLAKAAGYSAATLSEAASGIRKPSLDVVLAYVGACQGDVELWRQRWYQLDAELAGEATQPTANASATKALATSEPPAKPATLPAELPPAWFMRWRTLTTVAVATVVVAAVGFVVGRFTTHWFTNAEQTQPCPKGPEHPLFTGVSYAGGAHVRAGADLDNSVVYTIPSGCTLGFTGFCLGQKVHDSTGGTADIRWFRLADGDVVASAVIHGNPPPTLTPVRCKDDQPGPATISLSVTADPARLRLNASGSHLEIVGFAVSDRPEPGEQGPRKWHQIALTEASGATFAAMWQLDQSRGYAAVVVVTAACLGGDGPTSVVDAKALRTDAPTVPAEQAILSAQEVAAAANSACQYPN